MFCFHFFQKSIQYSYYIDSLGNLSTECHSGVLLDTFQMFQDFEKIERIHFDAKYSKLKNKQFTISIAVKEDSPVLMQGSVAPPPVQNG